MILWHEFFTALALVLVLEGFLPFLNPSRWRKGMKLMMRQDNKALRIMGLISMILGLGLLYSVR